MGDSTIRVSTKTGFSLISHMVDDEKKDESIENEERIIFVLDKSGSMSGAPLRNVKKATEYVRNNQPQEGENVKVSFVTFGTKAVVNNNINDVVDECLYCMGRTNFIDALDKCIFLIKQQKPNVKINIIFMTDGCDNYSGNSLIPETMRLGQIIKKMPNQVTITTLAFGSEPDINFLTKLREYASDIDGGNYIIDSSEYLMNVLAGLYDISMVQEERQCVIIDGKKYTAHNVDGLIEIREQVKLVSGLFQPDPKVDWVCVLVMAEGSNESDVEFTLRELLFQLSQGEILDSDALNIAEKTAKPHHRTHRELYLQIMDLITDWRKLKLDASIMQDWQQFQQIVMDVKTKKARRERKQIAMRERGEALFKKAKSKQRPLTEEEKEEIVASLLMDYECPLSMDSIEEICNEKDDFPVIGLVLQYPMKKDENGVFVSNKEIMIDAPWSAKLNIVSGLIYSFKALSELISQAIKEGRQVDEDGYFRDANGIFPNAFIPIAPTRAYARKRLKPFLPHLLASVFMGNATAVNDSQYMGAMSIFGSIVLQGNAIGTNIKQDFLPCLGYVAELCVPETLKRLNSPSIIEVVERFSNNPSQRVPKVFESAEVVAILNYLLDEPSKKINLRVVEYEINRRKASVVFRHEPQTAEKLLKQMFQDIEVDEEILEKQRKFIEENIEITKEKDRSSNVELNKKFVIPEVNFEDIEEFPAEMKKYGCETVLEATTALALWKHSDYEACKDTTTIEGVLEGVLNERKQRYESHFKKELENVKQKQKVNDVVSCPMKNFIHLLQKYGVVSRESELFKPVVKQLLIEARNIRMEHESKQQPNIIREKLAVLLVGKHHKQQLFEDPWTDVDFYVRRQIRRLIPKKWKEVIKRMHVDTYVGWTYRSSDIQNRHGHCVSNPNNALGRYITFDGFIDDDDELGEEDNDEFDNAIKALS